MFNSILRVQVRNCGKENMNDRAGAWAETRDIFAVYFKAPLSNIKCLSTGKLVKLIQYKTFTFAMACVYNGFSVAGEREVQSRKWSCVVNRQDTVGVCFNIRCASVRFQHQTEQKSKLTKINFTINVEFVTSTCVINEAIKIITFYFQIIN